VVEANFTYNKTNLQLKTKAMKKSFLIAVFLYFSLSQAWSQDKKNNGIPLMGFDAPPFIAQTTNGEIEFPGDFGNNWKIIFAHPQDFTPVCSSELLELAYNQESFENLGVSLLVISHDNLVNHANWKSALEEISYRGRDPIKIDFPLISDIDYQISDLYGMVPAGDRVGRNIRSVFIIDSENKVRAVMHYPNEVGRNIDELKRTVIALQATTNKNIVTPANWKPGDDVMLRYLTHPESEASGKPGSDIYQYNWFMTFKRSR
jgi:peroxiredoxin 2/4